MAEMASGAEMASQLFSIWEKVHLNQEHILKKEKNGNKRKKTRKKPEKTKKKPRKNQEKNQEKNQGWPEPAGAGQTGQTGQNVRCRKT